MPSIIVLLVKAQVAQSCVAAYTVCQFPAQLYSHKSVKHRQLARFLWLRALLSILSCTMLRTRRNLLLRPCSCLDTRQTPLEELTLPRWH